ncbi:MAG: Holliday junction branch migration protein RuvA [Firmicutes bacterium]|nr:Holliday junction branch migration protein RuvA [Bacillota bacterium]
MYCYIKGELVLKKDNYIIVDNNGIGYKIFTSASTMETLREGKVTIYTYLYVREDTQDLFGFATNEELSMFLHLISVSGVGPKAALAILSVTTPEKFALAVITSDTKTITKAQGVGPKLAQRVILELKDKLKNEDMIPPEVEESTDFTDNRGEAVSALMVLGYAQKDAASAVGGVDPTLETEEIVKRALKNLMR